MGPSVASRTALPPRPSVHAPRSSAGRRVRSARLPNRSEGGASHATARGLSSVRALARGDPRGRWSDRIGAACGSCTPGRRRAIRQGATRVRGAGSPTRKLPGARPRTLATRRRGCESRAGGRRCGVGGACRGPHTGRPRRRIRVLACDRRKRPDACDRRRVRRPEARRRPGHVRRAIRPARLHHRQRVPGEGGADGERQRTAGRRHARMVGRDHARRRERAQRLPELPDRARRGELRNLRGPRLGGERGGRAGRRRDLQLLRRPRGRVRRGRNGRLRPPGHRDHRRIGRLGLPQLGFRVRSRRRAGAPRRPRRAAHGRVRRGHDAEAEGKRRAQERGGVERHRATQQRRTEADRR